MRFAAELLFFPRRWEVRSETLRDWSTDESLLAVKRRQYGKISSEFIWNSHICLRSARCWSMYNMNLFKLKREPMIWIEPLNPGVSLRPSRFANPGKFGFRWINWCLVQVTRMIERGRESYNSYQFIIIDPDGCVWDWVGSFDSFSLYFDAFHGGCTMSQGFTVSFALLFEATMASNICTAFCSHHGIERRYGSMHQWIGMRRNC